MPAPRRGDGVVGKPLSRTILFLLSWRVPPVLQIRLSSTQSQCLAPVKGRCAAILTRSVLACGCAPHAASGCPLDWHPPLANPCVEAAPKNRLHRTTGKGRHHARDNNPQPHHHLHRGISPRSPPRPTKDQKCETATSMAIQTALPPASPTESIRRRP